MLRTVLIEEWVGIGYMGFFSKDYECVCPQSAIVGTSGNLISINKTRSPHLSVVHEPYEFLQKDTYRP